MGQYVGIDLHRRSSTIYRMAEDGEVLGTERFLEPALRACSGHGCRRARTRSGARVHLRLVLGRRSAPGAGRPRAPGPCARQQLGEPPRQERRARRPGPRRHAGSRAPRRGLDRPARDPRAARARALPLLAGATPHQCQGPDPRGHGQERDPPRRGRAVGPERSRPARQPRAPRGLYRAPRFARATCSTSTSEPSPSWTRTSTPSSRTIPAIGPSSSSPGWARSSPPSSWPRSATSPASTRPRSSAPGPASPPNTASPTRWSTAGRSPSRVHHSCAGRPSRPSATTGPKATRSSAPTFGASPSTPASTKPGSPSPASCSTLVFYALRDGEVRCLEAAA